jgi:hypothetical protein
MLARRISATVTVASLISLLSLQSANAGPVDISALVNADVTTYSSGDLYPQNGGPLTVGGVGFNLATIGPDSHTAVIQTSDTVASVTIPVGEFGITTVYTLINSIFGIDDSHIGTLEFFRSGSLTPFTYDLFEGTNVRDHFQDGFVNTVSDPTVVSQVYTGHGNEVRFDRQTINLPVDFSSDTLVSVVLTNLNVGFAGAGQPFLAAITTSTDASTVPVPAALPLFASGLAALAILGRRRRTKKVVAASAV